MPVTDVTSDQVVAGHKAEAEWYEGGQSGPKLRLLYQRMLEALGLAEEEVAAKMADFHQGHLDAGHAVNDAWERKHTRQDGTFAPNEPRPVADIFKAMHGAS